MVKAKWYKAFVSTKEWNNYYSKVPAYTFLRGTKEKTEVGFIAAEDNPPEGCLEITDIEDLRKIDLHCEANHQSPRPFEIKK